ncbi:biotin-dependent carboxyltransferase family protein [Alkalihalobacillus pseudalcaliphilus]|uniref:5-oxoprolinase subunit C family protein n=1 Tax=Alkalihalobacillus pseudalcaliphilus TaxID=79884 RepID=UPI00064D8C88|nr:biotin-dependent carboxyltransferase family protein [Alkalihalobacillus pseudalcaliphilus]KMK77442.1 hypothetical protein AB990_02905 [Alkalihalobacillus pseudalcaliphilus]
MGRDLFVVKKSGLLTTIQDRGRYQFLQSGLTPSGAADFYAFQVANLLLGNHKNEPALELTLVGPTLRALSTVQCCLTGADFEAHIEGNRVSPWSVFTVKKGETIQFSYAKKGMRAYLAVTGGFAAEQAFGSASTFIKAEIGGIGGRSLAYEDVLRGREQNHHSHKARLSLQRKWIPSYHKSKYIRVMPGPEENFFTEESYQQFWQEPLRVSNQSDRMGLRLENCGLVHKDGKTDILSDAVTFGTIQVPASGEPIILLADRQTTGGYPRIGQIISVDLPQVAQTRPGEELHFVPVTVEEAQEEWRAYKRLLRELEREVRDLSCFS